MPKHEEYEQLCALAMVGDASEEELYNLRRHLEECESCRREYREFSQLVLPQLWAMDDGGIPSGSEAGMADTTKLRESFLNRAQAQGISFSTATLKTPAKVATTRSFRFPQFSMWSVAAMAGVLCYWRSLAGDSLTGPSHKLHQSSLRFQRSFRRRLSNRPLQSQPPRLPNSLDCGRSKRICNER